jgi:hypothetical protein
LFAKDTPPQFSATYNSQNCHNCRKTESIRTFIANSALEIVCYSTVERLKAKYHFYVAQIAEALLTLALLFFAN